MTFLFADRETPTVKDCPHDVHVRLNSLEPYTTAQWIEPTFTDNMAVTHVIKTKEPGSLFAIGEHIVSYTASDASGNTARCQFTVNVLRNDQQYYNFIFIFTLKIIDLFEQRL